MGDDPRCAACGSDLDANDGAHYHGCGNAGYYFDEPATIHRPQSDVVEPEASDR